MKKSFVKVLPFAAAVLFLASCSKDNNDEKTVENQPKVEKVVIPFSVKVNTGNSISKIAYTQDGNDVSNFNVNFTDEDINTEMNIASEGNIEPSILKLDKDGDNFVFKGEITLADGKTEADFNNGFEISGSFGTAGDAVVTSTTSLADAMSNCSHAYTSTFSSTAATINLDDNYAYLELSCASTQTKFNLTIGGISADYTPNSNKQIWIAVPKGTQVAGNLVKTMTVEGGKVYRADRKDVVDLGLSVLWCTANYTNEFKTWSQAISLQQEHYILPTSANFNELIGSNVTKTWKSASQSGLTLSTDCGSVFFPALGHNKGNNVVCDYWASDKGNDGRPYHLYWAASNWGTVGVDDASYGFPVRFIRVL